jgi:hypothetical protein
MTAPISMEASEHSRLEEQCAQERRAREPQRTRKRRRFESPLLHQEVLVSGGGFQGFEISRPYKLLVGPSAVCDGHLAGLSKSFPGPKASVRPGDAAAQRGRPR